LNFSSLIFSHLAPLRLSTTRRINSSMASATVCLVGSPREPASISASRVVAHAVAWAFVGKVADSLIPSGRRTILARHLPRLNSKVAMTGVRAGIRRATNYELNRPIPLWACKAIGCGRVLFWAPLHRVRIVRLGYGWGTQNDRSGGQMESLADLLAGNFVGIGADLSISSGYDNTHPEASVTPDEPIVASLYGEKDDVWSVEDRRALADAMIERWERYRAAIR